MQEKSPESSLMGEFRRDGEHMIGILCPLSSAGGSSLRTSFLSDFRVALEAPGELWKVGEAVWACAPLANLGPTVSFAHVLGPQLFCSPRISAFCFSHPGLDMCTAPWEGQWLLQAPYVAECVTDTIPACLRSPPLRVGLSVLQPSPCTWQSP